MGIGFFFKNVIIRNLLLVILFSAGLAFGISKWLNTYTRHGESVEIPDVKSMKPEVAQSFFDALELTYQVIDSSYNKKLTPGTIIQTLPPAGSRVKKGRTVYFRLNASSAGTTVIPDVRDVSYRQATAMLRTLGFERIETRQVKGYFRDLVVGVEYRGQELQINEPVPVNAVLTLLVGSGRGVNPQDSIEIMN